MNDVSPCFGEVSAALSVDGVRWLPQRSRPDGFGPGLGSAPAGANPIVTGKPIQS